MGCGASSESSANIASQSELEESVARLYKAGAPNVIFLFGAESRNTEALYAEHLVERFSFHHIDAAALRQSQGETAAAANGAAPAPIPVPAATSLAAALFNDLKARPAGSLTVVTGFPASPEELKAWADVDAAVPRAARASAPHVAIALQLDSDKTSPESPLGVVASSYAQVGLLRRLPSGVPPARGIGLLYRAALDLTAAATALPAAGLTVAPVSGPLEVVFVVAPPGARKKEICAHLAAMTASEHVSMGDELKAVAAAATADATAAASPAPVTDAAAAAAAGSSVAPAPAPLLPAADAAAVAAALSAGDLVSSETAVVVLSAAIRARAAQGQRSLLVSGFPRGEADRAAWERAHAGVLSPAAIVVVAADAAAADAVLASRAEPPAVVAAKRAAWTAQSEPLLAAAEAEPGAGGVVRVPGVSADRGVAVVANAVRRALLGAGAPLTAGVPEVETTYAMIKPDAVAAGYTDAILERIRAAGFSIAARQDLTLPEETAKAFYAEHKARPFYTTLVQFMTSGPIVALALRRRGAILAWRKLAGPTNSHRARAIAPNSLRATFGVDGSFNAVHGSDSRVAANRELQLVFGEALPVGLLNPLRGYRLVLAGGPASGKGTQAELLRDALGVVHISTGELLRDEKKSGSTLGLKAAEYAEKGQLVPDDVMIPLVLQRVTQPDCARRGWLLDGFPRTAAQAKALRDAGLTADVCVVISVPDEVLVERVAGRVMCTKTGTIYHEKFNPPPPGTVTEKRADDTEEKVRTRIESFKSNVAEVKNVFGDIVVVIRGDRDKRAVFDDVLDQLPAAL